MGPTKLTAAQESGASEVRVAASEMGQERQYSALPGHVRHRTQSAIQQGQSRGEFTARNIMAVPAFSQHSFEIPDDYQSFTDPASAAEGGGEGGSREATLRSLHLREQALRRAGEIGLDRAMMEVNNEREEYLARFGGPGRDQ